MNSLDPSLASNPEAEHHRRQRRGGYPHVLAKPPRTTRTPEYPETATNTGRRDEEEEHMDTTL